MEHGLKKQKERLNLHKELLEPWLPHVHAYRRMNWSPDENLRSLLQKFCRCDPKSLETAARFFGLDHTSMPDCAILAAILAEVIFGATSRGRKRGAATSWDGPSLIQLGRKYRELKTKNPNYTDTKIAELISEDKEFSQYRNDPEPLRKKLGDARAELFHMERSPGDYYYRLRVSGENSIAKSLTWPASKR